MLCYVRLGCTGQDLMVSPGSLSRRLLRGKGGFMAWRMYALYRVPSSFRLCYFKSVEPL